MNPYKRPVSVIGGIIAGTSALFVGGILLTATPALADNGPHVTSASSTTVERCAGCHRTHAAGNPKGLIVDQVALCTTCHGAGGTGAATDVIDGIGYTNSSRGTQAGALRSGGFSYALLDASNADKYATLKKVPTLTLANKAASTSAHSVDGTSQTAWGNGAINSGVGTSISLTCGSCHDPHGNGNYRILRAIPVGSGSTAVSAQVATLARTSNVATVTTTVAHNLIVGQAVQLTGLVQYPTGTGYDSTPWNGRYTVVSVPTATSITFAKTGTNLASTPAYGGFLAPAGIPDSTVKSYTTTNYWAPDDDNSAAVSVTYGGVSKGSSQFIANISQWCSTCHSRYLATTGSYSAPSGDNTFTYRHTSDQNFGRNTSNPQTNCITCHVAHGSNAKMDGANTSTLKDPSGANPSNGSRLLRIDNRGTCNMCHDL